MKINDAKRVVRNSWILTAGFVLMLAGACGTLPLQSPESAFRGRVDQLMTAKVKGDWPTVYEMMDNAYRNKVSKDVFLNQSSPMDFGKYTIESIAIDDSGQEAVAVVKYDMQYHVFEYKDQPETQHWIKDGGRWYLKGAGNN